MKEIKFEKREKDNQLIVDVKLPRRQFLIEPVIEFSNSDMIAYLKESGVNLTDYELASQTSTYLTSYADTKNEPILNGTWIFRKNTKTVNKKTTKTSNKKASTKTGD